MVARGHGIETLCLYLAAAQAALFGMIVALGLPTPHDRPHRRAGGRNPWQAQDVSAFVVLWMEGWAAASLAERFGRSRGGIWSKARQLGLPRRERRGQFRPSSPHAPVQLSLQLPTVLPHAFGTAAQAMSVAASLVPSTSPSSPTAATSRSPAVNVGRAAQAPNDTRFAPQPAIAKPTTAKPVPLLNIPGVTQAQLEACLDLPPITRKSERGEIVHDPDRDLQLALRVFSSQHYVTAAREMGISVSAFTSRRRRLELPVMARGESVEEFNPEWAAGMIRALGLKRLQCQGYKARGVEFHFWCKQTQKLFFSPLAKTKAWYKDAITEINYGYC